jgi:hypothetical protein
MLTIVKTLAARMARGSTRPDWTLLAISSLISAGPAVRVRALANADCQLAPLAESVPPKLYGGTERVIAWLVDELVESGHEVTLFASGDSKTKGLPSGLWCGILRTKAAGFGRC